MDAKAEFLRSVRKLDFKQYALLARARTKDDGDVKALLASLTRRARTGKQEDVHKVYERLSTIARTAFLCGGEVTEDELRALCHPSNFPGTSRSDYVQFLKHVWQQLVVKSLGPLTQDAAGEVMRQHLNGLFEAEKIAAIWESVVEIKTNVKQSPHPLTQPSVGLRSADKMNKEHVDRSGAVTGYPVTRLNGKVYSVENITLPGLPTIDKLRFSVDVQLRVKPAIRLLGVKPVIEPEAKKRLIHCLTVYAIHLVESKEMPFLKHFPPKSITRKKTSQKLDCPPGDAADPSSCILLYEVGVRLNAKVHDGVGTMTLPGIPPDLAPIEKTLDGGTFRDVFIQNNRVKEMLAWLDGSAKKVQDEARVSSDAETRRQREAQEKERGGAVKPLQNTILVSHSRIAGQARDRPSTLPAEYRLRTMHLKNGDIVFCIDDDDKAEPNLATEDIFLHAADGFDVKWEAKTLKTSSGNKFTSDGVLLKDFWAAVGRGEPSNYSDEMEVLSTSYIKSDSKSFDFKGVHMPELLVTPSRSITLVRIEEREGLVLGIVWTPTQLHEHATQDGLKKEMTRLLAYRLAAATKPLDMQPPPVTTASPTPTPPAPPPAPQDDKLDAADEEEESESGSDTGESSDEDRDTASDAEDSESDSSQLEAPILQQYNMFNAAMRLVGARQDGAATDSEEREDESEEGSEEGSEAEDEAEDESESEDEAEDEAEDESEAEGSDTGTESDTESSSRSNSESMPTAMTMRQRIPSTMARPEAAPIHSWNKVKIEEAARSALATLDECLKSFIEFYETAPWPGNGEITREKVARVLSGVSSAADSMPDFASNESDIWAVFQSTPVTGDLNGELIKKLALCRSMRVNLEEPEPVDANLRGETGSTVSLPKYVSSFVTLDNAWFDFGKLELTAANGNGGSLVTQYFAMADRRKELRDHINIFLPMIRIGLKTILGRKDLQLHPKMKVKGTPNPCSPVRVETALKLLLGGETLKPIDEVLTVSLEPVLGMEMLNFRNYYNQLTIRNAGLKEVIKEVHELVSNRLIRESAEQRYSYLSESALFSLGPGTVLPAESVEGRIAGRKKEFTEDAMLKPMREQVFPELQQPDPAKQVFWEKEPREETGGLSAEQAAFRDFLVDENQSVPQKRTPVIINFWATGTGKTRAAMLFSMLRKVRNVLIVAHNAQLVSDFVEEFKKGGADVLKKSLTDMAVDDITNVVVEGPSMNPGVGGINYQVVNFKAKSGRNMKNTDEVSIHIVNSRVLHSKAARYQKDLGVIKKALDGETWGLVIDEVHLFRNKGRTLDTGLIEVLGGKIDTTLLMTATLSANDENQSINVLDLGCKLTKRPFAPAMNGVFLRKVPRDTLTKTTGLPKLAKSFFEQNQASIDSVRAGDGDDGNAYEKMKKNILDPINADSLRLEVKTPGATTSDPSVLFEPTFSELLDRYITYTPDELTRSHTLDKLFQVKAKRLGALQAIFKTHLPGESRADEDILMFLDMNRAMKRAAKDAGIVMFRALAAADMPTVDMSRAYIAPSRSDDNANLFYWPQSPVACIVDRGMQDVVARAAEWGWKPPNAKVEWEYLISGHYQPSESKLLPALCVEGVPPTGFISYATAVETAVRDDTGLRAGVYAAAVADQIFLAARRDGTLSDSLAKSIRSVLSEAKLEEGDDTVEAAVRANTYAARLAKAVMDSESQPPGDYAQDVTRRIINQDFANVAQAAAVFPPGSEMAAQALNASGLSEKAKGRVGIKSYTKSVYIAAVAAEVAAADKKKKPENITSKKYIGAVLEALGKNALSTDEDAAAASAALLKPSNGDRREVEASKGALSDKVAATMLASGSSLAAAAADAVFLPGSEGANNVASALDNTPARKTDYGKAANEIMLAHRLRRVLSGKLGQVVESYSEKEFTEPLEQKLRKSKKPDGGHACFRADLDNRTQSCEKAAGLKEAAAAMASAANNDAWLAAPKIDKLVRHVTKVCEVYEGSEKKDPNRMSPVVIFADRHDIGGVLHLVTRLIEIGNFELYGAGDQFRDGQKMPAKIELELGSKGSKGSEYTKHNPAPVGSTVKIFWTTEKEWFTGEVVGYDAKKNTHHIIYDDGDVDDELNLAKEKFHVLSAAPSAHRQYNKDHDHRRIAILSGDPKNAKDALKPFYRPFISDLDMQHLLHDASGDAEPDDSDKLFNAVENCDGSIIKVLIVTQKGSTGISLRNCHSVFFANPQDDITQHLQMLGRAIRRADAGGRYAGFRDRRKEGFVPVVSVYGYMSIFDPATEDATKASSKINGGQHLLAHRCEQLVNQPLAKTKDLRKYSETDAVCVTRDEVVLYGDIVHNKIVGNNVQNLIFTSMARNCNSIGGHGENRTLLCEDNSTSQMQPAQAPPAARPLDNDIPSAGTIWKIHTWWPKTAARLLHRSADEKVLGVYVRGTHSRGGQKTEDERCDDQGQTDRDNGSPSASSPKTPAKSTLFYMSEQELGGFQCVARFGPDDDDHHQAVFNNPFFAKRTRLLLQPLAEEVADDESVQTYLESINDVKILAKEMFEMPLRPKLSASMAEKRTSDIRSRTVRLVREIIERHCWPTTNGAVIEELTPQFAAEAQNILAPTLTEANGALESLIKNRLIHQVIDPDHAVSVLIYKNDPDSQLFAVRWTWVTPPGEPRTIRVEPPLQNLNHTNNSTAKTNGYAKPFVPPRVADPSAAMTAAINELTILFQQAGDGLTLTNQDRVDINVLNGPSHEHILSTRQTTNLSTSSMLWPETTRNRLRVACTELGVTDWEHTKLGLLRYQIQELVTMSYIQGNKSPSNITKLVKGALTNNKIQDAFDILLAPPVLTPTL